MFPYLFLRISKYALCRPMQFLNWWYHFHKFVAPFKYVSKIRCSTEECTQEYLNSATKGYLCTTWLDDPFQVFEPTLSTHDWPDDALPNTPFEAC